MGSRRLNGKLNIISEDLIKYRKRQGISQEVLCKKLELLGLNMIPNDIYKIENNLRTVKDQKNKRTSLFFYTYFVSNGNVTFQFPST